MVNVNTRRRRSSWIVLLSLTLVVLAFAFAACGSDSGSSPSSSGSANTSSSTTSSSTTSSSSSAAQMVNIKESRQSGKPDVYTCDPTSITIKKGDSITFTNQSDEKQDFDEGDAQKAGVDFVLDLNGSKTVSFNTAGTFMLQSEKGATITVTVQ